jgi:hypothetical protein
MPGDMLAAARARSRVDILCCVEVTAGFGQALRIPTI